ncbi:myb/SANT-like domain-containing protein [Artemisia annua]|uniref:Myb/SANT-like domain-containing protein n=1 Tax=Artemisia annua TaxID=35608 RepID=A0A2U1MB55_ARTAN|nr:myb/SANT-like domain-containing protein [Artemisia annua]
MDNVDGNETKNGNEIAITSGRKKKVKNPPLWDNKMHLVFVELCLNEARHGNKPAEREDRKRFDIQANKKPLGKDWKLYDRLLRLEYGIGWDPIRQKIDASPEWWDEKIKADEELEKETVAVRDKSKLPLDCRLVDEDEQQLEGKGDSDEINAYDDQVPLFPESSSSKRKKSINNGSVRSTRSKNFVTSEFDEKVG